MHPHIRQVEQEVVLLLEGYSLGKINQEGLSDLEVLKGLGNLVLKKGYMLVLRKTWTSSEELLSKRNSNEIEKKGKGPKPLIPIPQKIKMV